VEEGREDRHHREGPPIAQRPAQHHGLELDGVLHAVRALGGEEIVAVASFQRVEHVAVDRRLTQRRVIGLLGSGEGIGHAGMTGAEDHEAVGVGAA
jgi:hypothetical protein